MAQAVVVADTSPINYLILIGEIEVLQKLFGEICIPAAVQSELSAARAPDLVRTWASNLPDWVQVKSCSNPLLPLGLDLGETQAISLAVELQAFAVIMDERLGRSAAKMQGLNVIGLLTIIKSAHLQGYLDARIAFAALKSTSFHLSNELIRMTLESLGF